MHKMSSNQDVCKPDCETNALHVISEQSTSLDRGEPSRQSPVAVLFREHISLCAIMAPTPKLSSRLGPSSVSPLSCCLQWGKRETNKHKEFWRDTPWFVSHLSPGHVPSVPSSVPSVPRTFCPLNVNFHINRPKRPGCPWDVPNLSPGRSRGIPTTKFLYVIFLCRFSSLQIQRLYVVTSDGDCRSDCYGILAWLVTSCASKSANHMDVFTLRISIRAESKHVLSKKVLRQELLRQVGPGG